MAANRPRKRFPRITLVLLLVLVVGGLAWGIDHLRSWRPDRTLFPLQGAILGAANAPLEWGRMAADGTNFVYLEATDGAALYDSSFLQHRAAARHAAMRYGAVHRFDFCATAADQAANFTRLVPRDVDALPPLVVVEERRGCTVKPSPALLRSEWQTLSLLLARHSGHRPILLLMPPFDDAYAGSDVAKTRAVARPLTPPESPGWTMWLASPYARVAGANGQVRWIVINPAL